MKFWKMNGAGNDFVVLKDLERAIPDAALPELARTLCERRMSLGADGVMVVRPAEDGGDFRMLFFNADGSVGEMCGNGARCICRWGYENGLAGKDAQRVETAAGRVTGYYVDGQSWRVRLNDPGVIELSHPVEVDGTAYDCAYAVVGVPHAVIPMKRLREMPPEALRDLGRKLRFHPSFPKGANVNFCEIEGPDRVFLRTYERGVEDFTYACGTGTGAVVLLLALRGLLRDSADVEMRGGVLRVDVERNGATIQNLWLTGPTNLVAVGELTDENVKL